MEPLFTAEPINAAQAEQFGMVNRVVPLCELDEATMELARKNAQMPPFDVMMAKRAVNQTLNLRLPTKMSSYLILGSGRIRAFSGRPELKRDSRRRADLIHGTGWMEAGVMGKPLSMDLRSRALAAVDEGMSCRAAAVRFGVAAATVIRWHDQRRSTGAYAAKPQGGDTRSRRWRSRRCTASSPDTASRAKKTGHAVERDRADVLSARENWFDGQLDLDPARLVFIDETWTAILGCRGRSAKGTAEPGHRLWSSCLAYDEQAPVQAHLPGRARMDDPSAYLLNQYHVFYAEGRVVGFAAWGYVSDEIKQRLKGPNPRLQPAEWKSGNNIVLTEPFTLFGGQEKMKTRMNSRKISFFRPMIDTVAVTSVILFWLPIIKLLGATAEFLTRTNITVFRKTIYVGNHLPLELVIVSLDAVPYFVAQIYLAIRYGEYVSSNFPKGLIRFDKFLWVITIFVIIAAFCVRQLGN